jgi:hypothetical protein
MIAYWSSKHKNTWWKDLARMCLERLSIPLMTTDPEWKSWGAKLTISDLRSRLGDAISEAFEYCKSWQCEGLIVEVHNEVWDMRQMVDVQCKKAIANKSADNWDSDRSILQAILRFI